MIATYSNKCKVYQCTRAQGLMDHCGVGGKKSLCVHSAVSFQHASIPVVAFHGHISDDSSPSEGGGKRCA